MSQFLLIIATLVICLTTKRNKTFASITSGTLYIPTFASSTYGKAWEYTKVPLHLSQRLLNSRFPPMGEETTGRDLLQSLYTTRFVSGTTCKPRSKKTCGPTCLYNDPHYIDDRTRTSSSAYRGPLLFKGLPQCFP